MHFRLYDIDAACPAVALPLHIMKGCGNRKERIHDAFKHFLPMGIQDRRIGHQMADITHQQQAPTMQSQRPPCPVTIDPIVCQTAGHHLATLLKPILQIPFHQPKPIAIDEAFVLSIHSGDGILTILNRADSGFQHNILDASL